MISINLVPKHIKDKIAQTRRTASAASIAFVIVIFLAVTAALVKATDIILLQPNLENIENQITADNQGLKQFENAKNEALIFNDRAGLINKIDQKRTRWAQIIPALAALVPQDIQIENISIDGTNSPNFSIQGTARAQDSVVLFKDKLTNSDYFKNVLLKNSSITTTTDSSDNSRVQKVVFSFELDAKYLGPISAKKDDK